MKRYALSLALLLPLAACHKREKVVVVVEQPADPVPQVVFESEPNNEVVNANFLGVLFPGDRVVIEGAITSTLSDLYDGFAFVAAEPLRVEFALIADNAADLDLCVYDPWIDDFSLCFANDGNEIDAFDVIYADAEFHLVVTPFDLPGGYHLEVTALPLFFAAGLPSAPPASSDASSPGAVRAGDATERATNSGSSEAYREGAAPRTEIR